MADRSDDAGRHIASIQMMERMVEEARRTHIPERRLGSLERLRRACDDILSGEAEKLARRVAPHDVPKFARRPMRLNPAMIEAYVRLRHRDAPEPKVWSGPTESFIRSDKEMHGYVKARLAEEMVTTATSRPKRKRTAIHHVLDKLNFEDRLVILQKLEEGEDAKRRLNLLRASLRKVPSIDVDALIDGRDGGNACTTNAQELGGSHRLQLRQLVARLKDPAEMREFGLVFVDSRLMMTHPPETELVRKPEFEILIALAGDIDATK